MAKHIVFETQQLDIMYFEAIDRKSKSTKINVKTCFLDEIKFKHVMN